ncbi:carboxypeptidase M32 [Desulfovibrio inopinatus]|uniref:carboxypeptidase M32 n=1 Tax=Desulfovibrio inopinatus TaxID=102109 RepID=UPI000416CBB0|nr:carboxypeptidase M32 [Desulfovibrio inopinatus]
MNDNTAYSQLVTLFAEVSRLESALELLDWDSQTKMPSKGGPYRAEQIEILTRIIHQRRTDPSIGRLLSQAEDHASSTEHSDVIMTNLHRWRQDYEREVKVPAELASKLAETAARAKDAWLEARKENSFAIFEPLFREILDLTLTKAEALGYEEEPYDALLDAYEPGSRTRDVAHLFSRLREDLTELFQDIVKKRDTAEACPILPPGPYGVAEQSAFIQDIATALGYNFQSGRMDESAHPFSIQLSPGDVRITIAHDESDFTKALLAGIHETGHALYSLGLPAEHFGTPMGQYVSLGVHESQSRLFENFIGRSLPFWEFALPIARQYFPQLAAFTPHDMARYVSHVCPDCIRVHADELTYNMHIMVRFEIELGLTRRELNVKDVPAAWNERMQEFLNITPPSDSDGALQDIHWSLGAIGYFPTYTLGNVYAAQLYNALIKDLGAQDEHFRAGDFKPFLDWNRRFVHSKGRQFDPPELISQATGELPNAQYLVDALKQKMALLL